MQGGEELKPTKPNVTTNEIHNPVSPVLSPKLPSSRPSSPDEKQKSHFSQSTVRTSIRPLPNQPHTPSTTSIRRVSILRWWLPELSATAFSIASLLAIVTVLQFYDAKSLADVNLPRYLTLNGLIAALATFDRVFLIVPVGSAISQETWLWFAENAKTTNPRSRLLDLTVSDQASRGAWGSFMFIFYARRRWLALAGALLTLGSLSIGTFTQQLISIENLAVQDPKSPLRPGNIPRTVFWNDTGITRGQIGLSTPLNALSPAYQGVIAETAVPAQPTCLTGNCTYPATPSLGICGACTALSYQKTACNSTNSGLGPHCNYTTATGKSYTLLEDLGQKEVLGPAFQVQYNDSEFTSGGVFYLSAFEMMGYPYGYLTGTPGENNLTASQCGLWACVNVWQTDVSSGIQNQSIVSTISQMTTEHDKERQTWHFQTNSSTDTGLYVADLITLEFLVEALLSLLDGKVQTSDSGYLASQDSVLAVWNGTTNLDQWINNLATTLTNYVRTVSPTPDTQYNGTAYQLGIKVQWFWIAAPAVMIVLSMVLLAVVIVRTANSEVSSWKASPLTLLLFHVDAAIRNDARSLGWPDVASGTENAMGNTTVVLSRDEDGDLVFKGV